MVSAAKGAEDFYRLDNNITRTEGIEVARQLDELTSQVSQHFFLFNISMPQCVVINVKNRDNCHQLLLRVDNLFCTINLTGLVQNHEPSHLEDKMHWGILQVDVENSQTLGQRLDVPAVQKQ